MKLGSRTINGNSKPYIIAEIGVNHSGSLTLAKELILLAKEGGADAAKFQSYKANKLASVHSPAYWDTDKEETTSQYELFKKFDSFEEDDYIELCQYCNSLDIDFLSTPFDHDAVNFLEPLVPFYKIASADINNIPLLRHIATKKKPVVISTGASTIKEIERAIKELKPLDNSQIGILHCILNYPTPNEKANLAMIKHLSSVFKENIIGYSDHTVPDASLTALTSSYIIGAKIIEKHFTHNKKLSGNDHYHAMDKYDLLKLNELIEEIDTLKGTSKIKEPIEEEKKSITYARRSLVANANLFKGHLLSEKDLICKRPGTGISPSNWDNVIGKKLKNNLSYDDILTWEDLE